MVCAGCKRALEANLFLKCNACNASFCFGCLNIDEEKVTELDADQMAKLKCPSCINVTRRRDQKSSCGSPKLNPSSSLFKPSRQTSVHSEANVLTSETVLLDRFSVLLDQKLAPKSTFMINLRSSILEDVNNTISKQLSATLKLIKEEFTQTTDFLMNEIQDVKSEIKNKDKIIKQLESDQQSLKTEIQSLNNRLNTVEKISRDRNIEIQAVPESKNENLFTVFKNVCDVLTTPILDTDILACRRVAKVNKDSDRPRNIIVTLSSPRMRDALLSATSRFNKTNPNNRLSSKHINIDGESRRIYLSEHLSPDLKKLHAAARAFAKNKNYQFVWVKYGQVYLRKDAESSAIRVKSVEFLQSLQ